MCIYKYGGAASCVVVVPQVSSAQAANISAPEWPEARTATMLLLGSSFRVSSCPDQLSLYIDKYVYLYKSVIMFKACTTRFAGAGLMLTSAFLHEPTYSSLRVNPYCATDTYGRPRRRDYSIRV